MGVNTYLLCFLLFFAFSGLASAVKMCEYEIYVKTANKVGAGTDSRIGVKLTSLVKDSFEIRDLASWGKKGPRYNYFERNALDHFTHKLPCLNAEICSLTLTSDASKFNAPWLCEDFHLSVNDGDFPYGHHFRVNQWLDSRTRSISIDNCSPAMDDDKKSVVTTTTVN
ncbi:PLAT domain-containing protein 2-like [Mercurialis annua]|uniref:PLAT domain-containing protein 2-like n=1 Tax=Mercurialis annua TaxID=3986 RepID=UPI00215EBB18|nr:PLAT domain-containing protein 2-like [Mercurialis annua]